MNHSLVDLFCELVQIDSESGHEGDFISHLAELFVRDLDAPSTIDAMGNLILRLPGINTVRTTPVLFAAHADTVAPGMGIRPIVQDGIISTDGTTILGADNKAAIAEILVAISESPRRPPLEILITTGEEIGLLGAKGVDASALHSKIGFVFDAGDLHSVILGAPTYIALDIEIIGRSAHAGLRPEQGISAIQIAADALRNMPHGRLDARTTANVGTIHAGSARNSVPDRAILQIECRSLDHPRCLDVAATIEAAFKHAAERAGAETRITRRVDYEASILPESAEVVRIAKQALAAAGLVPEVKTMLGGTDAVILNNKGIDVVVMGYGGREAHSTREHIAIADMERSVDIMRHLLLILSKSD